MHILITGFMPFGGHETNVTKLILDDFVYNHPQTTLFKVILPTVFDGMLSPLKEAIATINPQLIIHLGEHAKAQAITLERVAINMDDARIPDNQQQQPIDVPIIDGGRPAYFTHLPIRAIEHALSHANMPVKVSYSAGTYVCNHLFYLSEHLQSETKNRSLSGFIHMPLVASQDERSSFDLQTLRHALQIILDTCIDYLNRK